MTRMSTSPLAIFVCGCNGSGKSTFIKHELQNKAGLVLIDPDRAAKIHDYSSIDAGKWSIRELQSLLNARASFVKESTLTSKGDFKYASMAKNLGYTLCLVYIGVDSAEYAIQRIRARVASGGHDIPEETVRRRFDTSIAALNRAIDVFDFVSVYDNTGTDYILVAQFNHGATEKYSFCPLWFLPIAKARNLPSKYTL